MAVGGVPTPSPEHAHAIADMALEVMEALKEFNQNNVEFAHGNLSLRIGIHTGMLLLLLSTPITHPPRIFSFASRSMHWSCCRQAQVYV